jgi:hypothetical protein
VEKQVLLKTWHLACQPLQREKHMKTIFRTFAFSALVMVLACASYAAAPVGVEVSRTHAAVGAFGCTVTGVTTANPAVVTCGAAHGLIDGDQIQITGVTASPGSLSMVNITGYAKITGYLTTTFALYTDSALATGVNATGTYASGGAVAKAQDISALTGNYVVRLRVETLTAAKNVVLCIQDSADGFVSDIVTLACANVAGPVVATVPVAYTWAQYQLPSFRLGNGTAGAGVTNARVRLYVTQIDGSGSVKASLFLEQ